MPKTVTIPGYDKPVDFPDSMSQEQINTAAKKLYEAKQTPAALERKAMDPTSQYKPTTVGGVTPQPTALGKFMEKAAPVVAGAAAPVLSTIGSIGGSLVAGPAGGVAGATEGGIEGEAYRQRLMGEKPAPGKVLESGATQGILESLGLGATKALEKIGAKAMPKVIDSVGQYLGLKSSTLPKVGKTAENFDDIAKTVLNEVGIKKSLPEQKIAIETARAARDAETAQIVSHPASKIVDFESKILDRAIQLDKRAELGDFPEATRNVVDANIRELQGVAKAHGATETGHMLPAQMHSMRKSIQHQITDWSPDTTNPRQWLLQHIYRDLNDSIAEGLPEDAAKMFRENNKIQTRLITAREAVGKEELAAKSKKTKGIVTKAARIATGGTIGALSGTILAKERGGDVMRDAAIGALFGAGLGSYGGHAMDIEAPVADIKAQQAISKAMPYLAKAAKTSPTVMRLMQTLRAINDKGK